MNTTELIQEIKITKGPNIGNLVKKINKNSEYLTIVINETSFLSDNYTISDRLFYIRENINEPIKCLNCGKNIKHVHKFCSVKCANQYNKTHLDYTEMYIKNGEKRKNLSIEEKLIIKEKTANTCIERYGVNHNFKIPEVIEKRKNTWITTYGEDNPCKADIVKEKIIKTNIERYGFNSPLCNDVINAKRTNTWINNLGCDNPSKSDKVIENKKLSYFQKTGYYTPSNNPDVLEKRRKTFLENDKTNNSFRYKNYKAKNDTIIRIQGYEGKVYDMLLDVYNAFEITNDISLIKSLNFTYNRPDSVLNENIYIPDFFIQNNNLIIEVKSLYLYNKTLDIIYLKAQSVINKNYNFLLYISKNGKDFKIKTYEDIKTDYEKIYKRVK